MTAVSDAPSQQLLSFKAAPQVQRFVCNKHIVWETLLFAKSPEALECWVLIKLKLLLGMWCL